MSEYAEKLSTECQSVNGKIKPGDNKSRRDFVEPSLE